MTGWVYLLTRKGFGVVCLWILLATTSNADLFAAVDTLVHFQYIINSTDFTSDTRQNVKFTASLDGRPDLPSWMKLEQRNPQARAILYGTPPLPTDAIFVTVVELTGWNKNDYTTRKQKLVIQKISIGPDFIQYQIDLKLPNYDLSNALTDGIPDAFLAKMKTVWPEANYVTKIDKSSNRPGGRFPLPGEKEGVFIRIGGSKAAPAILLAAKYCSEVGQPSNSASQIIYDAFSTDFVVDWCTLATVSPSFSLPLSGDDAIDVSEFFGSTYVGALYTLKGRDVDEELLFLLIPVGLGILIATALLIVMFCHQEGVKKRQALTPREQKVHHKSLDRAATQLRDLSNLTSSAMESQPSVTYRRMQEESSPRDPSPRKYPHPDRPPPYLLPPMLPAEASDVDSIHVGPPSYRPSDGARQR